MLHSVAQGNRKCSDLIGAVINVGCLQEDDILLKDISRHFMAGSGMAIPYEEYVIGRRSGNLHTQTDVTTSPISKEHLNS